MGALFGGAAYFGLRGLDGKSQLEACSPQCAPADVDAVSQKLLAADILLASGVLAAGAATYLFLDRPSVRVTVGLGVDVSGSF